jgi:hypothetical protein
MDNKYTLKCTFAIEIQPDKFFPLVWVTSINKSDSCSRLKLIMDETTRS